MTVWCKRGPLYKAGFVTAMAGAVLFVCGFCAPTWASFQGAHDTQRLGLWQHCVDDLSLCASSVESDNPGWLKAVRALECISMFFAVAACIIGLYSNFRAKSPHATDFFNKNMETSAVVTVIFGVFGLIIFASQIQGYHRNMFMLGSLSWGFVLVAAAHTLLGFGAFVMLVSYRIRLIALQDYFAHRQLDNTFHTDVDFPDYTSQGCNGQAYITNSEGELEIGPPAYETVVNCTPQDDPAPPPYSEVVNSRDSYIE